ncbi:hypothetical protein [Streptomyces sp. NPDC001108]
MTTSSVGERFATTLVRLCAAGDVHGLKGFYEDLHAALGDRGHLHPVYDALDQALCEALAGRYVAPYDHGRAEIAAELVLTGVGPSGRVRAAVRRAVVGDSGGLTTLTSAEERVLGFAASCAALDRAVKG